MPNLPDDRVIYNFNEEVLSGDFNFQSAQDAFTRRFLLEQLYGQRTSDSNETTGVPPSGFIGEGFRVKSGVGLQVRLQPGYGFQYDATGIPTTNEFGLASIDGLSATQGVNELSAYRPLSLTTNYPSGLPGETIDLAPAPPFPKGRIDLIEVRYQRIATDKQMRNQLDPPNKKKVPTPSTPKTVRFALNGTVGTVNEPAPSTSPIGYKVGIASNSPAAPTPTPGYLPVAQIRLIAGQVAVDDSSIMDMRPLLFLPHGHGLIQAQIGVAVDDAAAGHLPTLSAVKAPPGVRIYAVQKNALGGTVEVYIVAGGTQGAPLIEMPILSPANTVIYNTIIAGIANTLGTITSGEQADIQGAFCAPAGSKVCVGQPRIKVLALAVGIVGGGAVGQTQAILGNNVTYLLSGNL